MNSKTIVSLFNFWGICSCALQGAKKEAKKKVEKVFYSLLNSFGGGFLRDTLLLKRIPWIMTISALPYLIWIVLVSIIYLLIVDSKIFKTYLKDFDVFIYLLDIFCLSAFIVIGIDTAMEYTSNPSVIILSGFITGNGGGILVNILSSPHHFLKHNNIHYFLTAWLGCIYYYFSNDIAFLTLFIPVMLFLNNPQFFLNHNNIHYFLTAWLGCIYYYFSNDIAFLTLFIPVMLFLNNPQFKTVIAHYALLLNPVFYYPQVDFLTQNFISNDTTSCDKKASVCFYKAKNI